MLDLGSGEADRGWGGTSGAGGKYLGPLAIERLHWGEREGGRYRCLRHPRAPREVAPELVLPLSSLSSARGRPRAPGEALLPAARERMREEVTATSCAARGLSGLAKRAHASAAARGGGGRRCWLGRWRLESEKDYNPNPRHTSYFMWPENRKSNYIL